MGGQLCRYLRHLPPGVRRNRASRSGESENGPQLCRYLRHLPPPVRRNRAPRSSESENGPDFRRNGTGVSANFFPKPRVFGDSWLKRPDPPENAHQNATRAMLDAAQITGPGKELGLIEVSGVALNS